MEGEAVPPKSAALRVLPWIACGLALAALLVTALRVRDAKLEARSGGEPLDPVLESPGPRELTLGRGGAARYEDFTLSFEEGRLVVRDRKGRRCVDFIQLDRKGPRGWQELQIEILSAKPEQLELRAQILPGSPSRGPGLYRWLKAGLRIETTGQKPLTVLGWDDLRRELSIGADGSPPVACKLGAAQRIGALKLLLEDERGPLLRLELE